MVGLKHQTDNLKTERSIVLSSMRFFGQLWYPKKSHAGSITQIIQTSEESGRGWDSE